ncbi:MAG: 6-bladed beta-propeller [Balneolaceae bacterium]
MLLEEYKTVISFDDHVLGSPAILKYNDAHLFVYDSQLKKVLKIDLQGTVVNEYGGEGRGPGEFVGVSDFFLADGELYIVDLNQFLIHVFEQEGRFNSSFAFTPPANRLPPPAPLPPTPPHIERFVGSAFMYNFDNQTHVTPGGDVLLPVASAPDATVLYEVNDRQGNVHASIGNVPERDRFTVDFRDYRSAIANREVPAVSRLNTFLVRDKSNPKEYFLIYSAIPKIEKYNLSGAKLWETEIPLNQEIESVERFFYESADYILDIVDMIIPLRKYRAGVSSRNGELYLATHAYSEDDKRLTLHHFSGSGVLQRRIQLTSDTAFLPIFDVDHAAGTLFIATEDAEIRAYRMP